MIKAKFNLVDNTFAHDKYSVAGRESKYIEWDRLCINKDLPTFFTHENMYKNVKNFKNPYGWAFESKSIIPNFYKNIEKDINRYIKVFTHNQDFIEKYDNCFWIPGGGIWIGGTYGKGEVKIHTKNKLCSMVSSSKSMCELHKFRLEIAQTINPKLVDIFGLTNWVPINETLENYMFSIVIENYKDDLYFTEKILNCFATGTIPIYYGAKKIGLKFDLDGIITFNNKSELIEILNNLNYEFYISKLESIEKNFNLCHEYTSIEDYIYEKYFK
jgi:hypothetical protein